MENGLHVNSSQVNIPQINSSQESFLKYTTGKPFVDKQFIDD